MNTKQKKSLQQFIKGDGLVLVVDDEPIMRKIAINVLKSCGYEVMAAENGFRALEIFEKHHPNIKLVLLDLLMPQKSGKETYMEMRLIQPDVNVLLVSGAKRDKRIKELLKMGVKGYVEKPYTFFHLSQLVHKVIYKKDKKT
jgi:two-component system cell cycle sensor histidine kinase/response regulator CckA